MSDKDLAYQFSGPYAQTLMKTVQAHFDQNLPVFDYFYTLSIDTAGPDQLAFIGQIVGYPWPSAPLGIFGDNNFTFGSAATFPIIDNLKGFADLAGSIGGRLSSTNPAVGNLIPIASYRLLLKQVAYLKFHGLTWISIVNICKVFGANFTVGYGAIPGDIYITFITNIGSGNLWLIQNLFDKFTTAPMVFVAQG